jgi:RNA-directed DNA polymerase
MSSGSYFPPPVRAVSIPKKAGGERILGVPTVADRVAQMVVKQLIEPDLDPIFLADSYGYRPRKSALDAVSVTRERCWRYDWVLEFDIKGLFDNVDHELCCPKARAVQMGAALHRKVVESANGTRGRDAAAPLKEVLSARFSRICLCITRSISGWRGHIPTFPGVGMPMTVLFTVETSKKPKPSWLRFKHV